MCLESGVSRKEGIVPSCLPPFLPFILFPFLKMRVLCLLTMMALCSVHTLYGQGQRYTISGFVTDTEDGEKLIGANLYVYRLQAGTVTNNYGFYSLTLPADSVYLRVSYLGYQTRTLALNLTGDLALDIALMTQDVQMDEVEVVGDRVEEALESTQMSVVDLTIEQVEKLPALLGEVDIIKAIQLLPGVQSGSEGSSGLYVRGGGPDQNLILLDGAPVYNVSHVFGFLSVFNAEALQNVRLIKGGFPARYGGRLSSVVDISMKEGNLKTYTAEGAVGLVSSKLTVQGPILRDKMSFIVSGRRTYIDVLARPFVRRRTPQGEDFVSFFYDLNAKLNYIASKRSRLYLSFYAGEDAFGSTSESRFRSSGVLHRERFKGGFDWGNLTATLRWNYLFSNKLFSNTTLVFSRYAFDVLTRITQIQESSPPIEEFEEIVYASGIKDWNGKIDFDYRPSPSHYIRFGGGVVRHAFNPGVGTLRLQVAALGPDEVKLTPQTFPFSAVEFDLYAEDDVRLTRRLKTNLGVHFSGMRVNKTTYTSLQPRLAMRYLIRSDWAVKASFSTMQQYLHLLTNTGINLPTDLWLAATDRVRPQQAWQAAVGATHTFGEGLYEASLEGYYKRMRNLIEYRPGANFIAPNEDWQDKVESGNGRAFGAEVFVQKKRGRTTGWLGYTLSWSKRTFALLNDGKTFPYRYDRRHDVSLVLTHKLSDRIDLGATWVYGTGQALTLATARFLDARFLDDQVFSERFLEGTVRLPDLNDFSARNSYRMGAYHRLDLVLNWHFGTAFFSERGGSTLSVGFYNAYNHKNPFFIFAARGPNGERVFKQATLFPILPAISYRFRF